MAVQIHLDPLGGVAGDMFVAAFLDARPDLWLPVESAVARLGFGQRVSCRLLAHGDGAIVGKRFLVEAEEGGDGHLHVHPPGGHEHHAHRSWKAIRGLIQDSELSAPVKHHAIAIFALLAEAEGEVHGVAADDVTFHEVGAVDSIVDIVAAAEIIAALDASAWTVAPLPLGSGRIRTAHGWLPVPAPATALLLKGFATIDDGIGGERVTPTGAAILRHLVGEAPPTGPRHLATTGFGFGTKSLPGISNVLRVLIFDEAVTPTQDKIIHRDMMVIAFEVDDQSPEDLAIGLDRLRSTNGVLDVVQSAALGKKGRMAAQIQILAKPTHLDEVTRACFAETTTIGLRYHRADGLMLPRRVDKIEIEGQHVRVKSVDRLGERTAKAEADDAADGSNTRRMRLRRAAEDKALRDLPDSEGKRLD
jgi:uncharacterized protein (TIGR00299 family) protein